MTRRAGHSTACRGPWKLFSYVLIALLALFAASCSSTRTMTAENLTQVSASAARDSTRVLIRTQTVERIPADTVQATVWPDSLARLPTDALFEYKHGRVGLKIRKTATGALHIQATSDSLHSQRSYYEERVTVSKKRAEGLKNLNRVQQTRTQGGLPRTAKMILCFALLGILLIAESYIKFIRKIWQ